MKHNKAEIKRVVCDLCNMQKHYITSFPTRENIPVYDWQLDLEMNEDFAIWEMEIKGE